MQGFTHPLYQSERERHRGRDGKRESEKEGEKEREREGLNFYACKGVHTLFTGQRERESERERK